MQVVSHRLKAEGLKPKAESPAQMKLRQNESFGSEDSDEYQTPSELAFDGHRSNEDQATGIR